MAQVRDKCTAARIEVRLAGVVVQVAPFPTHDAPVGAIELAIEHVAVGIPVCGHRSPNGSYIQRKLRRRAWLGERRCVQGLRARNRSLALDSTARSFARNSSRSRLHMTRFGRLLLFAGVLPVARALAQSAVVTPSDNLVTDGLPPVPAAIAAAARPYSEFRAAGFWDWHPTRREMIIGT